MQITEYAVGNDHLTPLSPMVIIRTTSFSSKWAGIMHLWVLYDSQCKVIISLNSIKKLIFVMVKNGVLFEVRTEFLNNI
jgi:hypothetical protein